MEIVITAPGSVAFLKSLYEQVGPAG